MSVATREEVTPGRVQGLWTSNFTLYFGARTVALLGDSMLPVALAAAVLGAGYGATGVGLALSAQMGAMVLFMLFGGVLADRFTPRKMMVTADVVRLIVQGAMAFFFFTGTPALWQIVVLQAISGTATALFLPGVAAVVPQVATDVQKANATLRVAEAMVALLGPSLAGALVAFSNAGVVFAIHATTFGVSALCIFGLRLSAAIAANRKAPMWRDLAEGWHEFRSRTWMWSVIMIWAVCGFFVFGPIEPLGATVIIGTHDTTAYGLIMSAFGGGAIVGGLVAMRMRPVRPLAAGAVAMLLFALMPLAAASGASVVVVATGYLLAGTGFAFWGVMWSTTVQTQIPAAVLSRVYAYDVVGSLMILPIGRAVAGPVSEQLGARELLYAGSVITVVCCAFLLAVPAIRGLRRAEPKLGEVA